MSQCICGHYGKFFYPLMPQPLCSKCFTLKFEKEVLKHMPRSIRGYPIAISLSGGKDSSTLLHILNKYQRKLRIPQLFAFILEEGIPEIQHERQKVINEFKKRYTKVLFVEKTFFDLFGQTLPNLVEMSDKKGLRFPPCAICGILRRHAILRLSLSNHVGYIAMGTTLNDEAETFLLNILRGNSKKNLRHQVNYQASDGMYLPQRIKPLSRVIEQKIRIYCFIHELEVVSIQCPFSNRSLRYQINNFLSKFEKKNPHVFYNILSSVNKSKIKNTRIKKVQRCIKCNSYSTDPECPACRLVTQIMAS